MPIIALLRPGHQPAIDQVRIAVADSAARDGYRLGPVVMQYPECSDCNAQWVTDDGSVWINGPSAGGRPGSDGEVLRVSAANGRVLQRFAVPLLDRALLVADRDGLWIAPSIETGLPASHLTPRAWVNRPGDFGVPPRCSASPGACPVAGRPPGVPAVLAESNRETAGTCPDRPARQSARSRSDGRDTKSDPEPAPNRPLPRSTRAVARGAGLGESGSRRRVS